MNITRDIGIRRPPAHMMDNSVYTIGIMAAATLVSLAFDRIGFSEPVIIMTLLLGVLLVAIHTAGYIYGISASVISVLLFNYFFTVPRYTLMVHDPQYIVTFTIMLAVSIMTSTQTARVKQQAELSALRERRSEMLYKVSQSMLKAQGVQEIYILVIQQVEILFGHPVSLYFPDERHVMTGIGGKTGEDDWIHSEDAIIAGWVFRTGTSAGAGSAMYPDAPGYYAPIIGQSRVLGVIGIAVLKDAALDAEQIALLEAVAAQVALALEREKVMEVQQLSKMEVERERLRNTLLRSISHDLRTPLTGIAGAAGTILDNYEFLEDEIKKKLLEGIGDDVQWLIRLVENLLSMTRIEAGKPDIQKMAEAVEEVVAEAVAQVKKRSGDHRIIVRIPDDLLVIPMDGNLIEQVLINLLENAVKYTPDGSEIQVRVDSAGEFIRFEVMDNGHGIPEKDLPHLFDLFYTGENANTEARKGSGLGLAICRTIVQAHGGEIFADNRPGGGALFQFTIPSGDSKEVRHE